MGLAVQLIVWSNDTEQIQQNAIITIHNSSFGNLDLKPGTKAQITDCYIDGEFKDRPTLMTANNANVLIQNCHFKYFINENGSTILFGHSNSHVTIENSVFIQHNSSKGVLLLQYNSSMHISSSMISQNVATFLGYSAIPLHHGIRGIVDHTVLTDNSALLGGAMYVSNKCQVTLTNCTFNSNKAITAKLQTSLKSPNKKTVTNISRRSTKHHIDQNNIRTYAPKGPTFFSETSLKSEVLPTETTKNSTAHSLDQNNTGSSAPIVRMLMMNQTSSAVKKSEAIAADQTYHMNNTAWQGAISPGIGGAVQIETQSQLLVTNCVFTDNSAQITAGAISAAFSVTLYIQGTTFVGNKALSGDGGAIDAQLNATLTVQETTFVGNKASGVTCAGGAMSVSTTAYLTIINCAFENNTSHYIAGAIIVYVNTMVDIQKINFSFNKAQRQSGAIDVNTDTHLRMTDCIFRNNQAGQIGGAIGGVDAVLKIQDTNFILISAQDGGAINVQQKLNIYLTNCTLERNFANSTGGAIVAVINVTLEIRETNFTGNTASEGGAISIYQSKGHVVHCIFHSNIAGSMGGAVSTISQALFQIENTYFTNNNSTNEGAINIDSTSKLQLETSFFWKNLANQSGGAINFNYYSRAAMESKLFLAKNTTSGGAIYLNNVEHIFIRSIFLLRNVALCDGGAITINGGTVTIDNITCVDNHATGYGGCLYIDSATLTLNNSEISENAGRFGAGVRITHSRIQVSYLP